MKKLMLIAMAAILTGTAGAQVMTKEIIYKNDSTTFKGFVAYDAKAKGKRPGILVVHEWWGLNDFIREKAKDLAAMGYVAFAPDMYGEGRNTTDPQVAAKMAGEVRGTPRMRDRVVLGLATLLKQEQVDPKRVAAMGFCFGGTACLELAYSGAGVKGVVTFHAGIVSPKPEDMKAVKSKFLVLHGADDPFTPPDSIAKFQESLRKAGVDWQMIYFSHAVHGFTNPSNGSDNSKGLAYNPAAATRAWMYMQDFLREIFEAAGPAAGSK
ncbi:MAG: dienelactone hydrolase family protein [Chitinispirillaceae bacterium]